MEEQARGCGHTSAEDYVAPGSRAPDQDGEVLSDSVNARDSCLLPPTGASESYGETATSGGNEELTETVSGAEEQATVGTSPETSPVT